MQIIERLLSKGADHGRPGTALKPKGVCVHYVGNPRSSAEANRNWFEGGAGGYKTSAHYIVGLQGEILRCVPETERAQHAGKSYGRQWDAQAPKNNGTYLGIEVCHPDPSGKFNDKTYAALVELVADICNRYGFNPATDTDVVRHYDICGKQCPLYYVKNPVAWEQLKKDVGGFEMVDKTKMLINGKLTDVSRILKDGTNYVSVRELAALLGFKVDFDAAKGLPVIAK